MTEAYFERLDAANFRPTSHTSGAWDEAQQHIGPALGLLAYAIESDRDRRRDDALVIGRLSYDILGTVPVEDVRLETEVLRAGRTIELVEARLIHLDRTIVVARAWLMQRADTSPIAGSSLPAIPTRNQMQPWSPSDVWPGGYLASVECHRHEREPGRAAYWLRPRVDLISGEQVSSVARACALVDIANGMTVRVPPHSVAFPNVDLTVHYFAEPVGEWLGFDTSVSFGGGGVGLTSSTLHDESGPIATIAQVLTVRPREQQQ